MSYAELAKRNGKELWRDPLSLGLTIALPVLMLVVLQALSGADDFFAATSLTPGIVIFGFVMLMFSAAMTLSKDRETAIFSRLRTTPLTPNAFAAGYSLPYLPIGVVQTIVIFAVAAFFDLDVAGSLVLVALIMLLSAVMFIGLGMITGALFTSKQVPFVYMVILLLAIFGGAWFDIEAIGGMFKTVGNLFPFAHALGAARDVMVGGAGFGEVASDIYWLLGYTVVIAALAVLSFRRRLAE